MYIPIPIPARSYLITRPLILAAYRLLACLPPIRCRYHLVPMGEPLEPLNVSVLSPVTSVSLDKTYWDPNSNANNMDLMNVTPTTARTTQLPMYLRRRRSTGNDVVSKNITMVLENLLKNYENNQLPTHGKGHSDK